MTRPSATSVRAAFLVIAASAALAACSSGPRMGVTRVKLSERECLARAMYFESNRSSDAGMLAVGTVVMNRVKSGRYGATVCEVVGAPRQFAPGVLTRSMTDSGAPRARRVADAVLSGRRHPGVQNAQFFHTAGYKFPYKNMRYVLVAGGNAFYDKTKAPKTWWGGEGRWGPPPAPTERIDGGPIMVASVEVQDDQRSSPVAAEAAPAPRRRASPGGADARMNEPAPPQGVVAGIPTYEPAPGSRPAREVRVASLEPARRPREAYETAARESYEVAPRGEAAVRPAARVRPDVVARAEPRIREDNGLREEDRWRDQDLAADEGRQPAENDRDWSERREPAIESAPLPVVQPAPEPSRAPRRARPAPVVVADAGYEEPVPSRDVRVSSKPTRVASVSRSTRGVEADPAALGWSVGAQPARVEAAEPTYDAPLSRAAEQDGYAVDAPKKSSSRTAKRSYGGVSLD